MLLAANKRLNTAYVLKESFGQLWSYEREGWARHFFENWRASLKWHRLAPSAMILLGSAVQVKGFGIGRSSRVTPDYTRLQDAFSSANRLSRWRAARFIRCGGCCSTRSSRPPR